MDKAQSSVNSFQIPFHVFKWPMAVVLSQQTVQTMFVHVTKSVETTGL